MERTCSDENVTTFDLWGVFDLSMIHLTLEHNKANGQSGVVTFGHLETL